MKAPNHTSALVENACFKVVKDMKRNVLISQQAYPVTSCKIYILKNQSSEEYYKTITSYHTVKF